ncbi:twin-arginine translocase subunit TatC [Thiosulfativibrio zosterae]|uniref:Sec-independent protein translocase protein TatC n=1 Tax=Thiosulfativibrio zosterae TaxID=2675053 RepID=A0A6F8PK41_9GAMM|nr:twin-arginine translocase subunit TatC [Thiosulfativibrio zosterae]BBP42465.1 hypothetical protein THMIRHAT_02110 [Thiosulfativibrio zosterae]
MSQTALPPNDQEMTLVQHLLELRDALTKGIIAIIVLFVCLFPFANDLYLYIAEPLTRFLPQDASMIATGVASPFLTPFKLSMVLAVYLAMPVLLYQVWTFIAPALYKHERQLVAPLLFFSSFLFYAGGAFAYYVVFPLVFGFLSTAAPDGVTIATDISLYLDFVIKMFFAFGIAFEVPIVVVLLILTGMATPEKLSHIRPYIVVGAFVIGMLLTPPDIISQTLLAVPMWLLYEAGIIVGGIVLKARTASKEAREAAAEENNESTSTTATAGAAATTAASAAATAAEPEFDNRYADQLDDDKDWDKEFEQIDSEFMTLEREYMERQAAEQAEQDAAAKAAEEAEQNKSDSNHANNDEVEVDASQTPKKPE